MCILEYSGMPRSVFAKLNPPCVRRAKFSRREDFAAVRARPADLLTPRGRAANYLAQDVGPFLKLRPPCVRQNQKIA
jgi:hypothetical protein